MSKSATISCRRKKDCFVSGLPSLLHYGAMHLSLMSGLFWGKGVCNYDDAVFPSSSGGIIIKMNKPFSWPNAADWCWPVCALPAWHLPTVSRRHMRMLLPSRGWEQRRGQSWRSCSRSFWQRGSWHRIPWPDPGCDPMARSLRKLADQSCATTCVLWAKDGMKRVDDQNLISSAGNHFI